MHAIPRNLATTLALTTLLVVGGCKSSTPAAPANEASSQAAPAAPPPAAPAATPATAPTSAAPTAGVAAAPAPAAAAAPTPAPALSRREAAPAPAPARMTVPSGTHVSVVMSQAISAKANNVGDSFSGELSSALSTSSGKVVFPRGTHAEGTVVAAKGRGKFKGEGNLAIQLTSIGGHEVTTSAYLRQEKGKGKRTAGIIGGTAGVGALIGGLAGGGKGALIGGLAGAGAGTAGAAMTGNKDIVIPAESVVTFTLQSPLTVSK